MKQEFHLRDIDDVERFESFFNRYARKVLKQSSGDYLPNGYLRSLYTYCSNIPKEHRILYAVLDLEITFLYMQADVGLSAGTWNGRFAPERTNQLPVLDDWGNFEGKMEILRGFNSFAFRCRAFWDKYMGILILLQDDSEYERFTKSQSRKRMFKRIAESWEGLPDPVQKAVAEAVLNFGFHDLIDAKKRSVLLTHGIPYPEPTLDFVMHIIEQLDQIRSVEAHGPGILRKSSLAMLPLEESRDFGLINHWNIANVMMHGFRETILDL